MCNYQFTPEPYKIKYKEKNMRTVIFTHFNILSVNIQYIFMN